IHDAGQAPRELSRWRGAHPAGRFATGKRTERARVGGPNSPFPSWARALLLGTGPDSSNGEAPHDSSFTRATGRTLGADLRPGRGTVCGLRAFRALRRHRRFRVSLPTLKPKRTQSKSSYASSL